MRVMYSDIKVVDCTSDPHAISYEDNNKSLAEVIKVITDDIMLVLTSDLIMGIRTVNLVYDGIRYETDYYSTWEGNPETPREQATNVESKEHKTYGLYFTYDHDAAAKGLLPGLTGVREAIKMIVADPTKLESLSVGVVWAFAGDASCADYITWCNDGDGVWIVNYDNQDGWTRCAGYKKHCKTLGKLLGKQIIPTGKDS